MFDNEKIEQQAQEELASPVQEEVDTPQNEPDSNMAQALPKNAPATPTLENNMRALREKTERIERERDELNRRLQEVEARNNPKSSEEEDLSLNLGESDLAEGRHLTKLQKQMRKQQEELAKAQQQMQGLLVETRLKAESPDIDKVVTAENLKTLSELYPEVSQMLNSSTDYYSKAKSAYTMIKKFGIHVEDNFSAERELAQRNANKPRPLASVSPQQAESPLSRANAFANGLTPELKKQLIKEMDDAAKNY
jgi:chromosome segregation ATPase